MKLNDTWFGIESTDNGHPFLIRGRNDVHAFQKTGRYGYRIDIIWEYKPDDDSLMPAPGDLSLMGEVENLLVEQLEHDYQSILAFVFTGNNKRVWYWYTQDKEEFSIRINDALSALAKLPIELFSEPDPNWLTYNDILD